MFTTSHQKDYLYERYKISIDLSTRGSLLNFSHYWMNPNESKVVKEEIISSTEISKEMKLEYVGEHKPLWQHSASILHDFEDPFMQKKSARDASFQFFKFISPTIGI